MAIKVQIPTSLRAECRGTSELSLSAANIGAALEQLERDHPALYRSICDETGALRRHVNLFVNDHFLHELEGLDTSLTPGDVLTIMPAVSGG